MKKLLYIIFVLLLSVFSFFVGRSMAEDSFEIAALDDFFGAGGMNDLLGGGSVSKFLGVDVDTATCDNTSIIFFWTAEALDFSGTNSDVCAAGTIADGADCSDVDDTGDDGGSGAAINAAAKKYGTNGLDIPTTSDRILFSSPSATIDDEGRAGVWVRITTFIDDASLLYFYYGSGDWMRLLLESTGTGELAFRWKNGGSEVTQLNSTGADLSADGSTWYFIEYAWKSADNMRRIYVNGVKVAEDVATSFASFDGAVGNFYIGNGNNTAADFHMDNIIVTTDSTQDLYTTCSATETFPN